jgi:transposase
MNQTLSYKLKIYPNFHKLEEIRYTSNRFGLYLQNRVNFLYYNSHLRFGSTKGTCLLMNQAQKEAMGIVAGGREAAKATSQMFKPPIIKFESCPAKIRKSKDSSFNYWVEISTPFSGRHPIQIPTLSTKPLNKHLKSGWKLSEFCKLQKFGPNWYAIVYVTKAVAVATPKLNFIGVDVGWAHGVARSDGYLGASLRKIGKKEAASQAERQRQGHLKKPFKTQVKQQLNIEVRRTLEKCKRANVSPVAEDPKVLANLKTPKFNRWARTYFSSRLAQRAREDGVYVYYVHPAYTSISCSRCGATDKKSRLNQAEFKCVACGYALHADTNAACNIRSKGGDRLTSKVKTAKIPKSIGKN